MNYVVPHHSTSDEPLQIFYGQNENFLDVTELALRLCSRRNSKVLSDDDKSTCKLLIPPTEIDRADLFGDPLCNVLKCIVVRTFNNDEPIINRYPDVVFNYIDIPEKHKDKYWIGNPHKFLGEIHSKLIFVGGNIRDEYNEQQIIISFLRPNNRVLEIGSNIGRNALVISSILSDSSHLVTIESDLQNVQILKQNRDLNGFKFQIIDDVLSLNSDKVKTDVLIVDKELYKISNELANILDDTNLIILKNNFIDMSHRDDIVKKFGNKGFTKIYNRVGGSDLLFYLCFHEVWIKNSTLHFT